MSRSHGPIAPVMSQSRAGTSGTVSPQSPSGSVPRLGGVAKAAVQHACSECGYATGKWLGRCPSCGSWGSLVEERVAARGGPPATAGRPLLRLVDVETAEAKRLPTGVAEL